MFNLTGFYDNIWPRRLIMVGVDALDGKTIMMKPRLNWTQAPKNLPCYFGRDRLRASKHPFIFSLNRFSLAAFPGTLLFLCFFLFLIGFFAVETMAQDGEQALSQASIRTWTSLEGRTLEGRLSGLTDSHVAIKSSDGKPASIPLNVLSSADLRYLREVKASVSAQFVRVELHHHDPLSLAEVEVISGGVNVATKGKATQSSVSHSGVPERAIDGKTDGHYSVNNSTTSTTGGSPSWWEVDLGRVHAIDEVRIYNRTDCCAERLREYKLILLGADRVELWSVDKQPHPSPSVTHKIGHPDAVALVGQGATSSGQGATSSATTSTDGKVSSEAPSRTDAGGGFKTVSGKVIQGKALGRKGPLVLMQLANGSRRPFGVRAFDEETREKIYRQFPMPAPNQFIRDYSPAVQHTKQLSSMRLKCVFPVKDKPVKGIFVVVTHWCSDPSFILEKHGAEQMTLKHDFLLIALQMKGAERPGYIDCETSGSADAFFKGLSEVADQTKRPEMTTVPIVIFGHEAGGGWAYNMAAAYPDRVKGFVCHKGTHLGTAMPSPKTPSLFVIGKLMKPEQVGEVVNAFEALRAKGGYTAFQRDSNDHVLNLETMHFNFEFVDAIMSGILPGMVPLTGDISTKKTYPWSPRTAVSSRLSWLPDAEFAERWTFKHREVSP